MGFNLFDPSTYGLGDSVAKVNGAVGPEQAATKRAGQVATANANSPTDGTQTPVYPHANLLGNPDPTLGGPSLSQDQNYGLNAVYQAAIAGQQGATLKNYAAAAPTAIAPTAQAAQGAAAQGTATTGNASGYNAAAGGPSATQAAAMLAAQGGYALGGPAQISTAGDQSWQAQQQQLANILQRQAAGGGVSAADLQLKSGMDQQVAAQLAVLGSQRGSTNAALAQRSAADQSAAAQQNLNQQMGIQRAQETANAQQALGGVLGTARGQAQNFNINQAQLNQGMGLANLSNLQNTLSQNAGFNQQANMQNAGLAQSANQFNAGQAQSMTLANLAAQNQANQFDAGSAQAMTLANMGAENAMTSQNLGAANQFGMANLENAQQTDLSNLGASSQFGLANLGLSGQYGLANQQAAIAAQDQAYKQQMGFLGLQSGLGQFAEGTALANQQNQAANALTQYGIDQGVAVNNAQANANLTGGLISGGAALGAAAIAASDESVKEGVTGGNPMMRSFLDAYRAAPQSISPLAPRAPSVFGATENAGSGIGGGIAKGITALAGAIPKKSKPFDAGGFNFSANGVYPSGGYGSPSGAADDDATAMSDDREKDAVMSGNRGMQSFLEQANAQQSAQASQGAQSNAFMQTGTAPSNSVDRQLPGGQGAGGPNAGYGGPQSFFGPQAMMGGSDAGGFWSGSFAPGGVTNPGSTWGGGIAQQGGVTSPSQVTQQGGVTQPGASTPPLIDTQTTPMSWATPGGSGGYLGSENLLRSGTAMSNSSLGGGAPTSMPLVAPAPFGTPGIDTQTTPSAMNRSPFGFPMALSDEREKEAVNTNSPSPEHTQEFLDAIHAHKYRYKDPSAPGAGPGTYVSPMAQEIEKSAVGKGAVSQGPDGTKQVNYGHLAGTMFAGQAMLNERVNKLEQLLRRGSEMHPQGSRMAG